MKVGLFSILGFVCLVMQVSTVNATPKAEDFYNEAIKAEQAGDCTKALDLISSVQGMDRKWQPARVASLSAKCQIKQGLYFQASNTLREALRIDLSKDDATPYRLMGMAMLKERRGASAEEVLQAGMKLHPNDPVLHDLLRQSYEIQKKAENARAEGAKAEQLAFGKAKPETKTTFMLPFDGEWQVKQGNAGKSSHFGLQEKYAWDFEKTDGKGAIFDPKAGDKKRNESSLSWKAPVLAPADGVVVVVVDSVRDNTLSGDMNRDEPLGNFVVIKHAEGEYSLLGHLLKGGIEVKVGDAVKAGQKVALCGNSGLSPESQLHFSVLSEFDPPLCRPANLNRFEVVSGKVTPVASGIPREGDIVRAQAGESASTPVPVVPVAKETRKEETRTPTGAVKVEKPVTVAKEEKKKEEMKKEDKKDKGGGGIGLPGLGLLGGAAAGVASGVGGGVAGGVIGGAAGGVAGGVAGAAASGAAGAAGAAEGAKGAAAAAGAGAAVGAAGSVGSAVSNSAGGPGKTPPSEQPATQPNSADQAGQGQQGEQTGQGQSGDQTGQGNQGNPGDNSNNGVRDHGQGEGRDGAGQGQGQGLDNGLKGKK